MSQSFTSMDARTQLDQRVVVYRHELADLQFKLHDIKDGLNKNAKETIAEVIELLEELEQQRTPDNLPSEIVTTYPEPQGDPSY